MTQKKGADNVKSLLGPVGCSRSEIHLTKEDRSFGCSTPWGVMGGGPSTHHTPWSAMGGGPSTHHTPWSAMGGGPSTNALMWCRATAEDTAVQSSSQQGEAVESWIPM
ncbi:hypothetical protein NHX12_011457 [Muraenolepis orangiensis]|uniref:Uncharacterized protein n=1 Tax=Muraenolepis orangiensis TaxID=630683 RepID=A0A9Q0I5Q7_9TELE|nr:hypothetical protein NHX12_011457 [Muraenolepis orangiensis]